MGRKMFSKSKKTWRTRQSILCDRQSSEREIALIYHNRYQTQKLLGAGGMGKVFLAKDLKTGKKVAVKILKDENKIEVNKNFKSNAKNTNKLLKKVDNILKKQKDVITLKIKKERILDENHEWGLGQVHYTQPYYLNILNQLKQISKNDKSLLSKIYELF